MREFICVTNYVISTRENWPVHKLYDWIISGWNAADNAKSVSAVNQHHDILQSKQKNEFQENFRINLHAI